MKMKRLAMALLAGLLISGAGTYLLGRMLVAKAPRHAADLHYLAPNRDLTAGETMKAEDFEMVAWPADTPLPGSFATASELAGRALLYPLAKHQPITERMLAAPGAANGLSGRIPEGMRAVALRTDEVMGVAGFLQPHTHVDVLATIHSDKDPEPMTLMVVQNAEILAAGHQLQPDPEGKPASVTVVTLLLSPSDAERAVLASQQGEIHFVLRGGDDHRVAQDGPVDLGELVDGHLYASPRKTAAAIPAVPAARPAHRTAEYTIETLAGDKKTTEVMPAVPE